MNKIIMAVSLLIPIVLFGSAIAVAESFGGNVFLLGDSIGYWDVHPSVEYPYDDSFGCLIFDR